MNVKVDFSNRKPDVKTSILDQLGPGQSYIHDHNGMKTPFAVWIATRRSRMGKKFSYSNLDDDGVKLPDGWFRIFVPEENTNDTH